MQSVDKSIDPIFRCDSCQGIVRLDTLHTIGCCDACGNKRMRNVTVLSPDEHEKVHNWGFTDFLAKFQGVPDEG